MNSVTPGLDMSDDMHRRVLGDSDELTQHRQAEGNSEEFSVYHLIVTLSGGLPPDISPRGCGGFAESRTVFK